MKRYWNVRHVPELAGLSPQEQTYILHKFRPLSFMWRCWTFRLIVIVGMISIIIFNLTLTYLPLLPDRAWIQIPVRFVAMFICFSVMSQVYIQQVRPHLAEARARLSDRRATTSET